METRFSISPKAEIVNEKTLIVAVDLGKNSHMGYCRAPNGREVKPFRFNASRKGFDLLWKTTQTAVDKFGLERAVLGFESTGSYGEPLRDFFKDKPGVTLVQVNPAHVKKMKEVADNSPNKTDQKDPRVIAQLIQMGNFLTCIIPEGPPAELRALTQARGFQVEERVRLSNRLQDLVYKIFPEFGTIIKDPLSRTGRYLLANHPAPGQIASLGVEGLTQILRKQSRGKLGAGQARPLWEAARDSVGVKQGVESICREIRQLLEQIEGIEKALEQIEAQLLPCLEQIPYSQRLLSIPGIGPVTVAGVLGETGGLERYSGQKALLKLAGLNLYEISSGKHQGERHISKRGRSLLRRLLFFAALNSVRKKGIMHGTYQEMIGRGMAKIKALVAISRKLLGIMYALVRDQRDYMQKYGELSKAA